MIPRNSEQIATHSRMSLIGKREGRYTRVHTHIYIYIYLVCTCKFKACAHVPWEVASFCRRSGWNEVRAERLRRGYFQMWLFKYRKGSIPTSTGCDARDTGKVIMGPAGCPLEDSLQSIEAILLAGDCQSQGQTMELFPFHLLEPKDQTPIRVPARPTRHSRQAADPAVLQLCLPDPVHRQRVRDAQGVEALGAAWSGRPGRDVALTTAKSSPEEPRTENPPRKRGNTPQLVGLSVYQSRHGASPPKRSGWTRASTLSVGLEVPRARCGSGKLTQRAELAVVLICLLSWKTAKMQTRFAQVLLRCSWCMQSAHPNA